MDVLPILPPVNRRDLRSSALAFAWTLAAILGAVVITLFANRVGPRLLAPIAVMLGYLYYGYNSPGRNTAKLADSVYFLGFLWTLYALINEFVFRRGQATDTDSVYRVFGYALVTTASGMFCRLALLQFHETASDQMEQAHDELDVELERLVRQMAASSAHLSDWRVKSLEALKQFDTELTSATKSIPETIRTVHTESAKAISETLNQAVLPLLAEIKEISPLTRKMKTAMANLEKTMTSAGDTITESSMTFAQRMSGAVDSAATAVSDTLRAAGTRLGTSATQYATVLETQAQVATTAITGLTDSQTKMLQFFEALQRNVMDVTGAVVAARQHAAELPREIATAIQNVNATGNMAADSIRAVSNETVESIMQARAAGEALKKTVDEVLDFVHNRMV